MPANIHRRQWLKESSMAALGLGFSLRSMANEEGITRNFGSEKDLINLGSNENPYGISPKSRQAIMDMMGLANRYQFNVASLQGFRKQLAERFNLGEDNILITAGSGEGLGLLARYFSKGNIVTAFPTFGILPNTAKRLHTEVKEIPLNYEKAHDLPAMLSAINNDTSLVYLVNPANPTSTVLSPASLKNFCNEASRKAVVLLDEAYIDYADAPNNESMLLLIAANPNVIVMRTFSKIHAMAGLRMGFIAAHPTLIKKLEDAYFTSSSYCLSNLTMAAAMESLNDNQHRQLSKQKNDAAKKYTFDELTRLGYRCIPSSTNFMFFNLKDYAGDFAQDMAKKNILLRYNQYPDGKWCRVSLGTLEEMQQFVRVMQQI
jgi:histidinol-phosphate aminotransferase